MRTIILTLALILGAVAPARSQSNTSSSSNDDPKALTVLNRMADNIGALRSCTFRLDVAYDEWSADADMLVKIHKSHEVFLVGPDKMLVNTTGDGGHRGFWYDGKEAYSYWYGENNYGRVSAPKTIIEMIKSIHEAYGVDFPAADLLYPTFVDDLLAQSQRISFLKPVQIGDQECFHIVAKGAEQDMELWIANDAATLPVKYLFRTREKGQVTEYEGTFTDWKMNPDLPLTLFRFTPPPGSREVRLVAKNEKPSPGGKKK
jgi:hypothetical protein